jgi:hypothetical protein
MSIAWLVPAVAHKQTRFSNPRIIDQRDLDYMIRFIANNINAGIVRTSSYIPMSTWVTVDTRIREVTRAGW